MANVGIVVKVVNVRIVNKHFVAAAALAATT
jgi:hypothetical protein